MATPKLKEKINFTEEQIQVLNGALIGDGCLYLHKGGVNANFIYTSKSKQHVEFVCNYFKQYWSGEGIKYTTVYDKRTNKEYRRYAVKTYVNQSFTDEYNRWYPDGKKHLPKDIILTPLTCLIWYIGDGGICHSRRSEYIKLSTHFYSKEDQENILLPQLQKFNPSLMYTGNNQYFIYIPHKNEEDFLQYIGECPFSDYTYKWEIRKYKNSIPKNHTVHEQEFCRMYESGMTYYAIAKKFEIEPNAVKYYLKKNKIYKNIKENVA